MSTAAIPVVHVHVRTDRSDPLDPPLVTGAWAIVRGKRVVQAPLHEVPEATTHAQGVLIVVEELLRRVTTTASPVRLVLPDRAAVDLLTGRTAATTPTMRRLVDHVRRLLHTKLPAAVVEPGRFYDTVPEGSYDDIWA